MAKSSQRQYSTIYQSFCSSSTTPCTALYACTKSAITLDAPVAPHWETRMFLPLPMPLAATANALPKPLSLPPLLHVPRPAASPQLFIALLILRPSAPHAPWQKLQQRLRHNKLASDEPRILVIKYI